MKQLPSELVKESSRKMTVVHRRISKRRNSLWKGWTGPILIDEEGINDTMVGRNYAYKPVVIKGNHQIGAVKKVEIIRTTETDLRGELAEQ
jgi:tRNA A37 methylthiotransferase MiaB